MIAPWVLASYAERVYSEPSPHFTHRVTTRRRSGAIVYHDCAAHLYWHVLPGNGSVPLIAFRGTVPTDLDNWLRDLKQWPVFSHRLGIGPDGFTSGSDGLYDSVARQDRGTSARGTHILQRSPILTGHSLGAALALRFAAQMAADGFPPPRQVVTFNGPYPGGRKLRCLLRDAKPAHYRHAGDVVSRVESLFGLYVPPSSPITIGPSLPPIDAHAIGNFTKENLYV